MTMTTIMIVLSSLTCPDKKRDSLLSLLLRCYDERVPSKRRAIENAECMDWNTERLSLYSINGHVRCQKTNKETHNWSIA